MTEQERNIQALENIKSLGEDMIALENNDAFKRVFGDHFIEAFAVTNVMNMAEYDEVTRRRTHEKMLARSHFVQFCEMTKEDAKEAAEALVEYTNQ